jgi:hypothetical protein
VDTETAGNDSNTGTETDSNPDEEIETDTIVEENTETDSDIYAIGDTGDGPRSCTPEMEAEMCGVDFCVDGYCCNLSCGGFCEACDV